MSGKDLCRMTKKRMTMSAPSKKSVIRRRKKGHFTESDLSYHTFMCVVHHDSIGLRDDDDGIDIADADTAEEPPADISFAGSMFLFDVSMFVDIILLCRIRVVGVDDFLDLSFECFDGRSWLAIFLLEENPCTKCSTSGMQQTSTPTNNFSL